MDNEVWIISILEFFMFTHLHAKLTRKKRVRYTNTKGKTGSKKCRNRLRWRSSSTAELLKVPAMKLAECDNTAFTSLVTHHSILSPQRSPGDPRARSPRPFRRQCGLCSAADAQVWPALHTSLWPGRVNRGLFCKRNSKIETDLQAQRETLICRNMLQRSFLINEQKQRELYWVSGPRNRPIIECSSKLDIVLPGNIFVWNKVFKPQNNIKHGWNQLHPPHSLAIKCNSWRKLN